MSVHPEAALLSAAVNLRDLSFAINEGVSPYMFHDYFDEATWFFEYLQKYNECPDRIAMEHKYPDFKIMRTKQIKRWCDKLKEHHAEKQLLMSMDKAYEYIEQGEPLKASRVLSREINSVLSDVESQTATTLDDWQSTYEEVKRRKTSFDLGSSTGWPSGFPTFDHTTGGLHNGRLIVVGARLGHGKTWLLLRSAQEVIAYGGSVLFVSLEMTELEITLRMHSLLSRMIGKNVFNPFDLQNGNVDLKLYEAFCESLKQTVQGSWSVLDASRGRCSAYSISANIEKHKPDVVFIDYLTLMEMDGSSDDHRAIAKLTRELKQTATSYGIPIVVASQLNRQAEGIQGNAGASNLARSDAIGQDADHILMIKQLRNSQLRKASIAKNRHGADGGSFFVEFNPAEGLIKEIHGNRADEIMIEEAEADDE
jgi:replicative DNA helicase